MKTICEIWKYSPSSQQLQKIQGLQDVPWSASNCQRVESITWDCKYTTIKDN